MSLQTKLRIIQGIALAVSASAMIFTLFALGHTETFSIEVTVVSVAISAAGAITLATIQWAGFPKDDKSTQKTGRSRRR